MRYLRKETVYMVGNKSGGQLIIPECFCRMGSFNNDSGQVVYIAGKSGSLLITSFTEHGDVAPMYDYSVVHSIDMLAVIRDRNIVSFPQEILVKANMDCIEIVMLYLLDLNTIEVFPLLEEMSGVNEEQANNRDTSAPVQPRIADDVFIAENANEILKVHLSDIYYFEKIKGTHNTCVVYSNGVFTFKSDLQDILARLDGGFVQCHKAFIANMSKMRRVKKQQGIYILHFDNNHSCPCSVFFKKAVLNWKY